MIASSTALFAKNNMNCVTTAVVVYSATSKFCFQTVCYTRSFPPATKERVCKKKNKRNVFGEEKKPVIASFYNVRIPEMYIIICAHAFSLIFSVCVLCCETSR